MTSNTQDLFTEQTQAEWMFQCALSWMPSHNALNKAYHEAHLHYLTPPEALKWHVPAILVPRRVRREVHADELVSKIKTTLAEARKAVEHWRPHLDQVVTRRVHHSPDKPYSPLHSSVVITRHKVPGYMPSWRYTYNQYNLATTLIDEYERFIDKVMASRRAPFTQLSRIHNKAKSLENSVDLISFRR